MGRLSATSCQRDSLVRCQRYVRAMWQILSGPELVAPIADHRRLRFVIGSDRAVRELHVEISGTAASSAPGSLPLPIGDAVRTDGRDAVERYLADGKPPAIIRISTTGMSPSIAPPIRLTAAVGLGVYASTGLVAGLSPAYLDTSGYATVTIAPCSLLATVGLTRGMPSPCPRSRR